MRRARLRIRARGSIDPINTKKRARAALSYAARRDTAGSYSHVARAVKRKYGSAINVGGKRKAGGRKRKGSSSRRRR